MATKRKGKTKRKKQLADEMEEWDFREDLGETERAYHYFCLYRDMDLPLGINNRRTLRKTAEISNLSLTTINSYSQKYKWRERCKAYDLYKEKQRRRLHEEELDKMYANHAKIGGSIIAKAMKKLLHTSDDMLTMNDVTKLLEIGIKTERISRGETIEGKLRNAKLEAEIDNLKNSDESSHVQIVDDIPEALSGVDDDIPDDE